MYKVARIIRIKFYFICEMCGVSKNGKLFQYQALSLVPRYKPLLLEICEDCIYKEVYGSKFWKKRKKEGALES